MSQHRAEPSGWIAGEGIEWPSTETRDAVVNRRRDLYDAMRRLEAAVARPTGLADWRIEIESALATLEQALGTHVRQVEDDDGLFAEVLDGSPHLAANIDTLREEHSELTSACHHALSMSADWDPATLRRKTNVLLSRIALHRQSGADLLFDAYNVDIAAAD